MEYFTLPDANTTLCKILEGESFEAPQASLTPPPPLSTTNYYGMGRDSMDYSCCAKNRMSAGAQTKVELLVELPPSNSSEESSSDLVSAPLENSSLVPIPLLVVAHSQHLCHVLNLSMSKQHAVRSRGHIDKDYDCHCYLQHGPFFRLDQYAPSTCDTICNWWKAHQDTGMSCSDSSESLSSGRGHQLMDRISSRCGQEVASGGGDDRHADGHDVCGSGLDQSGSVSCHGGP